LEIGGRTYRVEIITRDSQSDQSRAADVASDLILKDKVDILTASSGSIDVNPVANIAELNEVPCITTDNPWESYYYGRRGTAQQGFDWTYHFFWGLEQVLAAFIGQWQAQDTNRRVGLLFNTAQDDTSWHNAFVPGDYDLSPDCVMTQGAYGNPVGDLQRALRDCYGRPIAVDRDFGPQTRAALVYVQGVVGTKQDGGYGPNTRSKMKFTLNGGGCGFPG